MSLHLCDLVDPDAVAAHLFEHLTVDINDEAVVDSRALAEEALAFSEPPAGAHVILARLAELAGDLDAFAAHTSLALAADPGFGPARDDHDHLEFLHTGAGRRASAARRAELLFHKADRWSGRVPQLDDQFAFAARVLGVGDARDHLMATAMASLWQFLGFLLFEGGLLARFEADSGPFLPAAERTLLATWHGVRHRLVRLDDQRGRRGRFTDLVTGEALDVTVLHDEGSWPAGREGLALLVPAGDRLALVGEPVLTADETTTTLRNALDEPEPLALATVCLQLVLAAKLEEVLAEREERIRFALPDVDPNELDDSAEGILEPRRDGGASPSRRPSPPGASGGRATLGELRGDRDPR